MRGGVAYRRVVEHLQRKLSVSLLELVVGAVAFDFQYLVVAALRHAESSRCGALSSRRTGTRGRGTHVAPQRSIGSARQKEWFFLSCVSPLAGNDVLAMPEWSVTFLLQVCAAHTHVWPSDGTTTARRDERGEAAITLDQTFSTFFSKVAGVGRKVKISRKLRSRRKRILATHARCCTSMSTQRRW